MSTKKELLAKYGSNPLAVLQRFERDGTFEYIFYMNDSVNQGLSSLAHAHKLIKKTSEVTHFAGSPMYAHYSITNAGRKVLKQWKAANRKK